MNLAEISPLITVIGVGAGIIGAVVVVFYLMVREPQFFKDTINRVLSLKLGAFEATLAKHEQRLEKTSEDQEILKQQFEQAQLIVLSVSGPIFKNLESLHNAIENGRARPLTDYGTERADWRFLRDHGYIKEAAEREYPNFDELPVDTNLAEELEVTLAGKELIRMRRALEAKLASQQADASNE